MAIYPYTHVTPIIIALSPMRRGRGIWIFVGVHPKCYEWMTYKHHKLSSISRTKSPKLVLSYSCLCQLYWSWVFSREWKCSWSSAGRLCSNYIWAIMNLNAYQDVSYVRGLVAIHVYNDVKAKRLYSLHKSSNQFARNINKVSLFLYFMDELFVS